MSKRIGYIVTPRCGWNPDNPSCVVVGVLEDGRVEITSNAAPGKILVTAKQWQDIVDAMSFEAGSLTLTKGDDQSFILSDSTETIVYSLPEIEDFWGHVKDGVFNEHTAAVLI